MILPLTYFIEKPFQNWTYENTDLLGSVILHVDYTVPVDRLRQRLDQIVHESKLWDGKVAVLQVTDAPANMVEMRALVSARNASQLWDLRCEVREKLIGFLQTECPRALPHERFEPADGPPCPEVSDSDDKMTGPAQPPHSDQPATSPVTSSATR
jgi:hypothetical protein